MRASSYPTGSVKQSRPMRTQESENHKKPNNEKSSKDAKPTTILSQYLDDLPRYIRLEGKKNNNKVKKV